MLKYLVQNAFVARKRWLDTRLLARLSTHPEEGTEIVVVISRRLLDGCSSLLEAAGRMLSILGGAWMDAIHSWRLLHGCKFLDARSSFSKVVGCLLIIPKGDQLPAVYSWRWLDAGICRNAYTHMRTYPASAD